MSRKGLIVRAVAREGEWQDEGFRLKRREAASPSPGSHDGVPESGVVADSSARHMGCVAFRGSKAHGTTVRARLDGKRKPL